MLPHRDLTGARRGRRRAPAARGGGLEQERIDRERQEEIEAKERAKRLEEQREREREAEQRLKEAQKQARVEELELLTQEAREEEGIMERRRAMIDEERARDVESKAWEDYRACTALPTGESDRELNTYISQLYDDMTEARIAADLAGAFELGTALERVAKTERISAALEDLKSDAVARGDGAVAARCRAFLHRLRDSVRAAPLALRCPRVDVRGPVDLLEEWPGSADRI